MPYRDATTIKPDQKYHGTVRDGSTLIEAASGTMGFQVMLNCEDGRIFYTIWITDKNRDRALKDFAALGVTEDQLQNPNYIEYQLGQDIVGREIVFGTKEEDYKGKTTVKVAWIGRSSMAGADGNKASAVARFFGGGEKKRSTSAKQEAHVITDDDIPF